MISNLTNIIETSRFSESESDKQFEIEDQLAASISCQPKQIEASSPVPEPKNHAEASWIPPGQPVKIGSFELPDGMIYVGSDKPNKLWRSTIDPNLPVASNEPDVTGEQISYWPSYFEMTPHSRLAFLQWLESGRQSQIDIGYVFVFFYGLERRFFHDHASSETDAIIAETRRLLSIYGENRSFCHYAETFIEAIESLALAAESTSPRLPVVTAPTMQHYFSMSVRIQIARRLKQSQNLDGLWLFAWHSKHPKTHIHASAYKAFVLYRILFLFRFHEKYPIGLKLELPEKKLSLQYKAASSDFSTNFNFNLPDISVLDTPWEIADEIAEQVQHELSDYCRYINKFPGDRYSLRAISHLPADIVQKFNVPAAKSLKGMISEHFEDGFATLSIRKLLDVMALKNGSKNLTKGTLKQIEKILSAYGYGIEPGSKTFFVRPACQGQIILFHLPEEVQINTQVTDAFSFTSLSLVLAVCVALADEKIEQSEQTMLEELINQNEALSELERTQLKAQTFWLLKSPLTISRLKRRFSELNSRQRLYLSNIAINMTRVDDHIDEREIVLLKKVFGFLGIPETEIFQRLYTATAASQNTLDSPVLDTAKGRSSLSQDHADEPAIPVESTTKPRTIQLNFDRVSAIREETDSNYYKLAELLDCSEDSELQMANKHNEPSTSTNLYLDDKHSTLLFELSKHPSMNEETFNQICKMHDFMPGGVLETLNEWFLDQYDEEILEPNDEGAFILNRDIFHKYINLGRTE